MIPFRLLLFLFYVLVILPGCNTLYQTKVIDIEIVEPGKVQIPAKYKKVAIRYNNCNVAPNTFFMQSQYNEKVLIDSTNLDSIASKIHYQYFVEELHNQQFFDSIAEIEAQDYSKVHITDTITYNIDFDSIVPKELNVYLFSKHIHKHPMEKNDSTSIKYLHPKLGLYEADELQSIADSTNAQLLISLDYYSSLDVTFHNKKLGIKSEYVISQAYWNFYDLTKQEYLFFYNRKDTVSWEENRYETGIKKKIPPQKDAVLTAADLSGTQFARFLIPHWIEVQRMYYNSGHVELKETDQLVKEGKWMEAAGIWKANSNNPNKSIAAKCKFNMGLACEMQGNLDAALEWVVESVHIYGQKNMIHYENCLKYIRILAQRKIDKKILDKQYQLVD